MNLAEDETPAAVQVARGLRGGEPGRGRRPRPCGVRESFRSLRRSRARGCVAGGHSLCPLLAQLAFAGQAFDLGSIEESCARCGALSAQGALLFERANSGGRDVQNTSGVGGLELFHARHRA